MDANAGARAAAKQRKMEKDAIFEQERLKFYNKEVQLDRTLNRNIIGYSRDLADAQVKALYTAGQGRLAVQDVARKYFANKSVNEGGRSTRFAVKQYQALLTKKAEVDAIVDNMYGRNMAYAQEGARRKYLAANAQAIEARGLPASYGAPVMMPPTNRLGGALQIASTVASIASGFTTAFPGMFAPKLPVPPMPQGFLGTGIPSVLGSGSYGVASDRRVKENIQQVGVSPQGYKIYEFNYKGGDVRFRGAMAQDVVQKNPMAVGIDQNYLTVDYSKIDVKMEVV
tara:strand:+ start:33 stop:884 length:852 start_codon:yes stop_codon:yes gene_type:complete